MTDYKKMFVDTAHSIIYLSSLKSMVFDEFGVVNGVVD